MLKWLISDFAIRFIVSMLSGLTVLCIARFIEAGIVDWPAVFRRSLPYGACFGTMWTLVRWRRLSGDIVVSNRGEPPHLYYGFLILLATPICLASVARPPSVPTPVIEQHSTDITLQRKTTVFAWSADSVTRTSPGTEAAIFKQFPAPPPPQKSSPAPPIIGYAIWPLCIIVVVGALGTRRETPSATFGLIITTLCTVTSEIAVRIA
ncbi:MAG: hypothetical protein VX589_17065 [Myxococcota bacterium]|nr:hypothetical protein [Myxococcota bacterium]